jgi:hypothetical protein
MILGVRKSFSVLVLQLASEGLAKEPLLVLVWRQAGMIVRRKNDRSAARAGWGL